MKKLGFLTLSLCVTCLMLFPNPGQATMKKLSDGQLENITAQAGISITATDHLDLDLSMEHISFGDDDGTDGTRAFLSFNDITMNGSVLLDNPVTVDVTKETLVDEGIAVTGVNLEIDGATIVMDKFRVGSITVGDTPGSGRSFGSIEISDYRAKISGKVRITTHP